MAKFDTNRVTVIIAFNSIVDHPIRVAFCLFSSIVDHLGALSLFRHPPYIIWFSGILALIFVLILIYLYTSKR